MSPGIRQLTTAVKKDRDRPNKAFLAAIFFALLLCAFEEYFFSLRLTYYLWRISGTELLLRLGGTAVVAISFLIVVLFSWIAFSGRKMVRAICTALLSAAVLAQYGYWNSFNRFMIPRDFNTAVLSDFGLWMDSASLFFNPLSILPILFFLVLLWLTRDVRQSGFGHLSLLVLFVVSFNSAVYHTSYRKAPAVSLQDSFKILVVSAWEEAVVFERETLAHRAESVPANNIVFVIDETIRGDHLSLNGYERPTVPYLDELAAAGYVDNWGIGVSAATCSVASNGVLLTGVSTLPDTQHRIAQNPTLFQYAQAMGYTTYHFDAQANYLWNGLTVSDLEYIDHRITPAQLVKDREVDFRAADQAAEIMANSTGNFIVINKNGVHFHYNDAYPPKETVWTPVSSENRYDNPEHVLNAYDNGLRYNVNTFFSRLIPDVGYLDSTVIVYTGDHGETLMQNGEGWAHCGSTKNEATVPLFIVRRPGGLPAVDTRYKASHYNLFATLLDLMHVPEEARHHDYPLSLLKATAADSQDRYYLRGNVGLFDTEAAPLINFDAE